MGDFILKKKIQIPGVEKCSHFDSVLATLFIVCSWPATAPAPPPPQGHLSLHLLEDRTVGCWRQGHDLTGRPLRERPRPGRAFSSSLEREMTQGASVGLVQSQLSSPALFL